MADLANSYNFLAYKLWQPLIERMKKTDWEKDPLGKFYS
jgi:hypothetical protein